MEHLPLSFNVSGVEAKVKMMDSDTVDAEFEEVE